MPRYKLTLAYDGTDFCGWQKQEPFAPDADPRPLDQQPPRPSPSKLAAASTLPTREGESRPRIALRTVQAVTESAIAEVLREPITLLGASRTDAGVHANGQVAAFSCTDAAWPIDRGLDRLLRAINSRLPDDILVTSVDVTSPDFDPIRGASSKAYSYTLHVSPPPPHGPGLRPLRDRRYVHHVWEPLDLHAMQAAASHFVGEHDFAAFAAAGHGRLSTIRTVFSCDVTPSPGEGAGGWASDKPPPPRLRIDITGSGFLWNMVRIIAGTLVDVGRGRKAPDDIPRILASRDRTHAGPTLPPTGLCLEWVRYA
ncbi:MAG: tRNA pseudouridine synthase A [Phycisphaerae bacterium]|nr:MAG: tRNA pseudouridine synthase A [Phycisphaerae bacterium]